MRKNFIKCLFLILILAQCQPKEEVDNSGINALIKKIESEHDVLGVEEKIQIGIYDHIPKSNFTNSLKKILRQYCNNYTDARVIRSLYSQESLTFMRYPYYNYLIPEFFQDNFFINYKPTITAIYVVQRDTIVKVSFTKFDSIGFADCLATLNFGITKEGEEIKFQNMVLINSRDWHKKRIGNIEYLYPDEHDFSNGQALKMVQFNLKTAKLFQTDPYSFRYFICESNIALQKLRGFDYKYDMYTMNISSGLAEPANRIIYAGNDSEYYPHELVHLYTKYWNSENDFHKWFDEGLATYLGGSRGKPLKWHLKNLAKYLDENGSPNLSNPFELPRQITNSTATIYAIGGLICKLAFEKGGMEAVKQLFMAGETNEDFYKGIEEVFGVRKEGLNDFLYSHIEEYR